MIRFDVCSLSSTFRLSAVTLPQRAGRGVTEPKASGLSSETPPESYTLRTGCKRLWSQPRNQTLSKFRRQIDVDSVFGRSLTSFQDMLASDRVLQT